MRESGSYLAFGLQSPVFPGGVFSDGSFFCVCGVPSFFRGCCCCQKGMILSGQEIRKKKIYMYKFGKQNVAE